MPSSARQPFDLPPGWAAALLWSRYHAITDTELENIDGLQLLTGENDSQAKWRRAIFRPRASSGRQPLEMPKNGGFKVYCRGSQDLFVVAAETHVALKRLLSYELQGAFQPKLRRYRIDVHALVERLVHQPHDRWFLTSAHGRTAGEGRALKVVSFYGEDVTESHLLRSELASFTFFSCNIRTLDGRGDLAAVSGDGSIAILGSIPSALPVVAKLIGFLFESGFLIRA